jgi:hypothetical protein
MRPLALRGSGRWAATLSREVVGRLESEIAARARRLVAVGAQAAFTDLHPPVWWDQGSLYVHPTKKASADIDLARHARPLPGSTPVIRTARSAPVRRVGGA